MTPDTIFTGFMFFLGVAAGFALAAVLGVVQLRRRPDSRRLEFHPRLK